MHPLVALALCIAIALIFGLPRKYVLMPWLFTVFLVPFSQVLVLGGVHFTAYRVVIICGLVRVMTTRVPTGARRLVGGFTAIDRAFIVCAVCTFITFLLQWMHMPALIKGSGSLLDAVGGYIVARFLISDRTDVERAITALVGVAAVLAICMTYEHVSHKNIFGYLGGIPIAATVRDGKVRSTGSFEVYITAGVFGATLLPLFLWLWSTKRAKVAGGLGLIAATAITIASNSSTPLLAYVGGIVGLCFWPIRKYMRAFRWGLVLVLLTVHLSMKAPVWALIARVDLTGSSSGFHRYMLIDQCIRHFSDWWLIGTPTYNEWGYDLWDLSDQYVACAVTGGLATIVAFVLVISRSFGLLGTSRKRVTGERKEEWFYWCLGGALLAHVVAYFGIGYFDQVQAEWYTLLAMIIAVSKTRSSSTRESDAGRVSTTDWAVATEMVGH
jgi:hypothetical protein